MPMGKSPIKALFGCQWAHSSWPMAEIGSSNQLNLLGHAEALQEAYQSNIIRIPNTRWMKPICQTLGIKRLQLLPSPLPPSPQPQMVISSKVGKDGISYYMWAGNCWNMKGNHWQLLDPRKPWNIDHQPSVARQVPLRKHTSFLPPLPTSIWQI